MDNFVGLLQEKCQKLQKDLPSYTEVEGDVSDPLMKCECKLYGWTTQGVGTSKKLARQKAAELMLQRVSSESGFVTPKPNKCNPSVSVAVKIQLFADKNRKEKPLYSEKDKDNALFVAEYKFDGYTAIGKGVSKKVAKANALEEIANHFKIHEFYENYHSQKVRAVQVKNSVTKLLELCQAKKLPIPSYLDKPVKTGLGKARHYVVSCFVNNLVTESSPNYSKKNAKLDASTLMLNKLNKTLLFDTPDQSPSQGQGINYDLLFPGANLSSKSEQGGLPSHEEGQPSDEEYEDLPSDEADRPSDYEHEADEADQPSDYEHEADHSSDHEHEDVPSDEADQPSYDENDGSDASDNDLLLPEANLNSDDEAPIAKRKKVH